MSEKPRKKTYWIVTAWMYLAFATIAGVFGDTTVAIAWLACAIICEATREILNAIERSDRT